MHIKHAFFFLLGAAVPGTFLGTLFSVAAHFEHDASFVDVLPAKIIQWVLILWGITMLARLFELWNISYEGDTPETHTRAKYVGHGILSVIYLFYAFFWLNPIWAIIRNWNISRRWENFWKTKI